MYFTLSGNGWPAGGWAVGVPETILTGVCLIVPSNLSFEYWVRRASSPAVSHDGGAGLVMLAKSKWRMEQLEVMTYRWS